MLTNDFISGGKIEIFSSLQPMQKTFSKLPAYFQAHPIFQHVYNHISTTKIMLGMILYKSNQGKFLILKDGTMHVPFDWQVYSLMRAAARMSICTGQTLRKEANVFQSRESYGDTHVDQLFQSLIGRQRQKLLICSHKMAQTQILKYINPQLYELVGTSNEKSLSSLLQKVTKTYQHPILLQFGLNALGAYYKEVDKGEPNNLDTLVITSYQGPLASQFIGKKLQIPLEKYYERAWISEKMPCTLQDNTKGQLEFEIFKIRK